MERGSTIRALVVWLGVIAAGGLILLAVLQHTTISRLRAENQSLRGTAEASEAPHPDDRAAENQPLSDPQKELLRLRNEIHQLRETLGIETNEIQTLRDQQTEIHQLRDQNKDLLRLRNEVHQLREQQEELEALRASNAKLFRTFEGGLSSNQLALVDAVRKEGAILGIVTRSTDASSRYSGAVFMQMMPNSPSAASDLKPGDIIVRIDGRPIQSIGELQAEMLLKKPGQTVILDVMRGDAPLRVPVQSRAWPEP